MPNKKNKRYLVQARKKEILETGLNTGKGILHFNEATDAMVIEDHTLAREIDNEHGLKGSRDVFVVEDEHAESYVRNGGKHGEGVHNFHFSGYSEAGRANYDRIFNKDEPEKES